MSASSKMRCIAPIFLDPAPCPVGASFANIGECGKLFGKTGNNQSPELHPNTKANSMFLSLNKASKEAEIAKSTLSEAIKSGRLSAEKDERGRYKIDPAELFRVFPKTSSNEQSEPQTNIVANTENLLVIERLQAELEAERRVTANMQETVADLRERLDKEGADRRALTAMLTDQTQTTEQGASVGWFDKLLGRKKT